MTKGFVIHPSRWIPFHATHPVRLRPCAHLWVVEGHHQVMPGCIGPTLIALAIFSRETMAFEYMLGQAMEHRSYYRPDCTRTPVHSGIGIKPPTSRTVYTVIPCILEHKGLIVGRSFFLQDRVLRLQLMILEPPCSGPFRSLNIPISLPTLAIRTPWTLLPGPRAYLCSRAY